MKFMIFDSHHKAKVAFVPEFENEARIYLCGPTVYDDAHLGHARSAISFDLLRRALSELGYKVTFARNITDIDDKIIKKMHETGESLPKITQFFTSRYHADMGALGVSLPDIEPKATDHIDAMLDLIAKLLEKNAAYKAANGDIYFDTTQDKKYGLVSNETQEEVVSRVETDGKKSSKDFVLWKAKVDGDEVFFDSPFGAGRPGWHIECSAMVQKHLYKKGAKFACDIHAGGSDLFFPHHENEAAQTRCGYGVDIAKYWMHNGFVRVDGEKMSKSLGNSFFVKDALKHYPSEALRFYLMSTHYRAGLNFNESDLISSKKRLDKIYRLKKRLDLMASDPNDDFRSDLMECMSDDLNISKALAVVDEMVANTNSLLDRFPKDKELKKMAKANIDFLAEILGIGLMDPYVWFQHGTEDDLKKEIEDLIAARSDAKKKRDFARSDEIRERLKDMGISIMDTATGTVWERI